MSNYGRRCCSRRASWSPSLRRVLEPRHAAFAYVAAWAEAATIGGFADWYAIVALFRRPLGLPMPHSAVIASNRGRIAESFGAFVRDEFLKSEPIAERIRGLNFAALAAEWIADQRRGKALACFALRVLPQALAAIVQTGLFDFVGSRVKERLQAFDLAPFAASLLAALVEDRRHQELFDMLLDALGHLARNERLLDTIREKIRRELPVTFSLIPADAYLVRRLLTLASTAINEARNEPDHALRREFDAFVRDFVHKLAVSPEYAARANRLKQELLQQPEVADLAESVWRSVVAFLENDSASEACTRSLAQVLVEIGARVSQDPAIRTEINRGAEKVLLNFIETNKDEIARFITDQINAWDIEAMLKIVELNIGSDLQFIRLNGTFVGGLAGLVLYSAERALQAAF